MTLSLLPVLARRWSPRAFDTEHVLTSDQVAVLLEAARWAPSAGNSEPWAFHPVARHADAWCDVVDHMAAPSRPWVVQASLLVVNICHARVEDTGSDYSEFAQYDLGQAVAHMSIQAHSWAWPAGSSVRSIETRSPTCSRRRRIGMS